MNLDLGTRIPSKINEEIVAKTMDKLSPKGKMSVDSISTHKKGDDIGASYVCVVTITNSNSTEIFREQYTVKGGEVVSSKPI